MRRRAIWPWPEPPLLQPLRPMAGSSYHHPFSSVPIARPQGLLRIAISGHQGEPLADAEPDGRARNGRGRRVAHIWTRLRIR